MITRWRLSVNMLPIVVFAFCALASGARLATANLDGRIVGGMATTIEKHPYQLSLLLNGYHYCGASIIAPNWALTAAHCVEFGSVVNYALRAGSSIKDEGGSVHEAALLIPHPNYGKNDYDFALIKVKNNFPLGQPGVQIVELADSEPTNTDVATVSGWGAEAAGGEATKQLRFVEIPVIDRETCQKRYIKYDTITERMICTQQQGGGKDACQGDSGGPTLVNGKQAGVVSWGRGCAERFFPGVHANIANQRAWIKENIESNQ